MSFSLGFHNEEWNKVLGSLMVPIPGVENVILVQEDRGKFAVIIKDRWEVVDNIIMAAAVVHDLINNYVATGGNHEFQPVKFTT